MSLNDTNPVESNVLEFGATVQRPRNNSNTSVRTKQKTLQAHNKTTEKYSETFVAQDGVKTTNFCSTEL